MKRCKNCNKEVPEDSRFCLYCGSSNLGIFDEKKTIIKKCDRCNKELPLEALFCRFCGKRAIEEEHIEYIELEHTSKEDVTVENVEDGVEAINEDSSVKLEQFELDDDLIDFGYEETEEVEEADEKEVEMVTENVSMKDIDELVERVYKELVEDKTDKTATETVPKDEYWIKNGKITCLGDYCKFNICPDDCPIYVKSLADDEYRIRNLDEAVKKYEEAIALEPRFYEACNNLATIYGEKQLYQKAYDMYYKAYRENPKYINAIYGLALTSRDLNRKEECLKWCDLYDSLCTNHRLDAVRDAVKGK